MIKIQGNYITAIVNHNYYGERIQQHDLHVVPVMDNATCYVKSCIYSSEFW